MSLNLSRKENPSLILTLLPFIFIFQAFCCVASFAQDTNHVPVTNSPVIIAADSYRFKPPFDPAVFVTNKYTIRVYGNVDYSSNSITSAFAGSFIGGNYIGDNLKQQVVSNLKSSNRFGNSLDYGIEGAVYNDSIGKKTFDFYVALKHRAYINATFTPDEFNLAFYGNASYAGKTASLSPSNYNNLSYQQIEIGSFCTNIFGKAELGLGLSFLAGQQFQNLRVVNGSLYTDPYGQYINLYSNSFFNQSDTGNGAGKLVNGYGASMDINFSAPIKLGKRIINFYAGVADLGFIEWNNRSLSYHKDTSYTYNGLAINGLNDLQNATINNLSKDSLQNKYLPEQRVSFYSHIPTTVNLSLSSAFKSFYLVAGYRYILNANYTGYYYLEGLKDFSHNWRASLQIGYGGYATYNVNFSFSKYIKHSEISLEVNHLQGIILPDKFGGAGVFLVFNHFFYNKKW